MRGLFLHTASSVLRLVPESKTSTRTRRERHGGEDHAAQGGPVESARDGYRLGLRAVTPLLPAVLAFGVSFGVLAKAAGMDAAASLVMLRLQVEGVLNSLTPRERRVVELRFGLEGDRLYTLSEIGEELGVTRERIRQIEAKALRKLRHPSRAQKLRDYAE